MIVCNKYDYYNTIVIEIALFIRALMLHPVLWGGGGEMNEIKCCITLLAAHTYDIIPMNIITCMLKYHET